MSANPDDQRRRDHELTKHLIRLAVKWPFWSTINFILEKKWADLHRAAAASTNGQHIAYDEAMWDDMSMDEREFVTLHEDAHVLLEHPAIGRALKEMYLEDYDHALAQEAADYAVNNLLNNSGIHIPEWVSFHDPDYDDMSFEEIYHKLMAERRPKKKKPTPDPDGDPTKAPNLGKTNTITGATKPKNVGNLELGPNDEAAKKAAEQLVEKALAHAQLIAGDMPSGLERVLNNRKADRVDWRQLLAERLFTSGATEYTWRKPNRVLLQEDTIIPGTREDNRSNLVFMVDTSGSITDEMLGDVADYIDQLRTTFPSLKINVLSHDTEVYDDNIEITGFGENILSNMKLRGGGGTYIEKAFWHVEKHYPTATAVIWLTDGEIFDLHYEDCKCGRCNRDWSRYIFIVTSNSSRVRGMLPRSSKVCRLHPNG